MIRPYTDESLIPPNVPPALNFPIEKPQSIEGLEKLPGRHSKSVQKFSRALTMGDIESKSKYSFPIDRFPYFSSGPTIRVKAITASVDITPKLISERPKIYKSKEITTLFKTNKNINNFMESIISEIYTSTQLSQVTYSINETISVDPEVPDWKTIVLSINIKDNETLDTVSLWNEIFDLCNKKIENMIKNESNGCIKKSFQKFSKE